MSSASSLEWTIPCAFLTKGSWYLSIKTEKSEGLSCDFFRISSSARSAKFVFKSKYILINLKYHNFSLPAILTPTPKCVGVEVDKIIIYCFGVCLKKSEPILRRTPTNEDAPPPPRGLGNPERKNTPFISDLARGKFLLKKERVFSFGVAGVLASAWGFLRAYDLVSLHHALRACLIRGSAGNESELFGIMTTILNLKKD